MPYIILDRDGVINYDSDFYIKSPDEWVPIPGSIEAIAKLTLYHFQILIATNQSGIARGHYDLATLHLIHQKFKQLVNLAGGEIKDIFFCPHHPIEQCVCRKPEPGMLYQMQKKYGFDFSKTFMIGDSAVDMQVAKTAGCIPLLVLTGNGKKTKQQYPDVLHFPDLAHAAQYVIAQKEHINEVLKS